MEGSQVNLCNSLVKRVTYTQVLSAKYSAKVLQAHDLLAANRLSQSYRHPFDTMSDTHSSTGIKDNPAKKNFSVKAEPVDVLLPLVNPESVKPFKRRRMTVEVVVPTLCEVNQKRRAVRLGCKESEVKSGLVRHIVQCQAF